MDSGAIKCSIEKFRMIALNLTLKVSNAVGNFSVYTIWIVIQLEFGDKYADDFVPDMSSWFDNGQNAIGAPNGEFALIYLDYGNGYLTLDMGINEEILDGDGTDFTIIAQGGNYTVSVSSTLSSPLFLLGQGDGNQSFDINGTGLTAIRYVRVMYHSGPAVELDAIAAINYDILTGDESPPTINPVQDQWIWENQTSIELVWESSDATPWNYTIYVNQSIDETGPWYGSNIRYIFHPQSRGTWEIILILYDAYENHAVDSVWIEVRSTDSPTTNTNNQLLPLAIASVGITSIVGFVIIIQLKKRKNS